MKFNKRGAIEGVHYYEIDGRTYPIVRGGDGPVAPGADLLSLTRAKIASLNEDRTKAMDDLAAATATAVAESRTDLTDAEVEARKTAKAAVEAIDKQLDGDEGLLAREKELADEAERRDAADALADRLGNIPDQPARVTRTNEPDLYNAGGEHSFIVDLYRQQVTPGMFADAADRLGRHMAFEQAERRDANVANFGGLIPPQYLVDMYAPMARAGRPFSNAIRTLPLPAQGTAWNISRITTGTTTTVQSAEGDTASETDIDETNLAIALRTISGSQDVSRQSLERGENIDQLVFGDLAAAYAVALNSANITALLATAGIIAVTYTDASPTFPEFHPKLADATQRINTNRFLPATFHLMHPRRWGWMTAQADSTGRPLVTSIAPQNPVGVGEAAKYGQVVGTVASTGLPVVTDASVPINLGSGTNEDIVTTLRGDDILLWEENGGAPRELRFEQPQGKKLVVELTAYGYSAFTAGRYPSGIATVGGTGLVTPAF